ncbi:MAG: hypothetical protein EXQ81_11610 [Thermoleophilia bacterium]|nr:hypothetical protein [Thermoleophilia bacterium]
MEALVATALGCVRVDLETDEGEFVEDEQPSAGTSGISLPLLIAADQAGERVAAVVDRRPPLVLSDDGGATWAEAGGGLPAGTAVAIHPEDHDLLLFASESRLFVSANGGWFWRALDLELIGITAVSFS